MLSLPDESLGFSRSVSSGNSEFCLTILTQTHKAKLYNSWESNYFFIALILTMMALVFHNYYDGWNNSSFLLNLFVVLFWYLVFTIFG